MQNEFKQSVRGAAIRAAERAHMRDMAAQNRSWEALMDNVRFLGVDLSKGSPKIISIQGERFQKTHVSA